MQTKVVQGGGALLACLAMLALGGCGGGSTPAPSPGGGGSPPTGATTYTVGGTVSGLPSGESVTLVNNGANALTLGANGTFTFLQDLPTCFVRLVFRFLGSEMPA
jgi:hypothetical protein